MPEFAYTARETSGRQVTGVLSASSQQEAIGVLASRQLFPVQVGLSQAVENRPKDQAGRVRARQLAQFYSQLADLLRTGVPLLRALDLLSRQSGSGSLRAIVDDVRGQVADGSRLYDAMRCHPRAFNELVVSMVKAGEEGGFLEDVLKRVAIFTDHQEDLKGKVIGAAVYPVFLTVVGIGVVVILLIYFVPQFEPIFERMRETGGLPWATTTLLAISDLLKHYGIFVLLALAGLGYGAWKWTVTERGRELVDEARLKIPGIGRISLSLSLARFCRVLGTLLNNGVPILSSLRIAKDATGNIGLSKAIASAADQISEGKSLARPLASSKRFPEQVIEMISVAEEANNLEQVLVEIADTLEKRTNRELELAVRMVEPILLVGMAAIVLFVVVALLLPILQSSTII